MKKNCSVGGQAVIEGVMMRGSKGIATAVRKSNGEIAINVEKSIPYTKRNKIFGIPIIRGFISLIESLIIGMKTLNYSASFFEDEDESEPTKFDKWFQDTFKDNANNIIMGFSVIISLVIAIGIFFILPTFAANLFKRINVGNTIVLNIIEGVIRVAIFIAYIYFIGKMDDIERVFQYHGAEHKTIFCYENEAKLIPENAARFGRLHPRCGTNFLFLVMIVSIIAFSLTGWNSIGERILYRIILLPVISGVTYEILKWMGRSSSRISKFFAYPGLMLQKLTTREPDLSQLEVAIAALKAAEGIDKSDTDAEEKIVADN
jgi:uncharacterized protein YqhQ